MMHRHKWQEVRRAYQPAVPPGTKAKGLYPDQLERFLFGITTVELCCTKCGKISSTELLGKVLLEE